MLLSISMFEIEKAQNRVLCFYLVTLADEIDSAIYWDTQTLIVKVWRLS